MVVDCWHGTKVISLFEPVSFPSKVLHESADTFALRVDRKCGVVVAADDGGWGKITSCSIRTRGFKQTKQAATTPRHICAWVQMLAPGSLSIGKC